MSPRPILPMFLCCSLASVGCGAPSGPHGHQHAAAHGHQHAAAHGHQHAAAHGHQHGDGAQPAGQCKHAEGERCEHHGQGHGAAPGHQHAAAPGHQHGAAPGHQHGAAPGHQHGGGMPHRFDDAEQWAKVFDDPARDEWQRPDEVVAALDLRPGMAVADVGAGTGYFLGRLVAKVGATGKVFATDLEPDMVRYLEQRAKRQSWSNVTAVLAKADDSGLAPASVDRILIVDVWHHLGDRRAYAAKLAATLRPGGKIAVVDFELDSRRGPPREHRLAATVIAEELRAAGLTVSMATETLPDQYIVLAAAR